MKRKPVFIILAIASILFLLLVYVYWGTRVLRSIARDGGFHYIASEVRNFIILHKGAFPRTWNELPDLAVYEIGKSEETNAPICSYPYDRSLIPQPCEFHKAKVVTDLEAHIKEESRLMVMWQPIANEKGEVVWIRIAYLNGYNTEVKPDNFKERVEEDMQFLRDRMENE